MKRRNFILLSGGTLAAAGISWALWPKHADSISEGVPPLVLSQLCDEQELMKIGKAYRKMVPDEDDASALSKYIRIDGNEKSINQDAQQSAIGLEEKSRSDFESGKTVILDGWVLSVTEARQCAAYSIVHTD
jgi:hypothetical protein